MQAKEGSQKRGHISLNNSCSMYTPLERPADAMLASTPSLVPLLDLTPSSVHGITAERPHFGCVPCHRLPCMRIVPRTFRATSQLELLRSVAVQWQFRIVPWRVQVTPERKRLSSVPRHTELRAERQRCHEERWHGMVHVQPITRRVSCSPMRGALPVFHGR